MVTQTASVVLEDLKDCFEMLKMLLIIFSPNENIIGIAANIRESSEIVVHKWNVAVALRRWIPVLCRGARRGRTASLGQFSRYFWNRLASGGMQI